MRYEYEILTIPDYPTAEEKELLNKMGSDRWELVLVLDPSYYFKRPLFPTQLDRIEAKMNALSFEPSEGSINRGSEIEGYPDFIFKT